MSGLLVVANKLGFIPIKHDIYMIGLKPQGGGEISLWYKYQSNSINTSVFYLTPGQLHNGRVKLWMQEYVFYTGWLASFLE